MQDLKEFDALDQRGAKYAARAMQGVSNQYFLNSGREVARSLSKCSLILPGLN